MYRAEGDEKLKKMCDLHKECVDGAIWRKSDRLHRSIRFHLRGTSILVNIKIVHCIEEKIEFQD